MKPLFRILPAGSPVTLFFNEDGIFYNGIDTITEYDIPVDVSMTAEWKRPWSHFQHHFPEQHISIVFDKKYFK